MGAYTVKGTAVGCSDYVALKGVQKFRPGKMSVTIKIYPLGAGHGPGVKRTVVLSLVSGGAYTVTGIRAKVKIIGE